MVQEISATSGIVIQLSTIGRYNKGRVQVTLRGTDFIIRHFELFAKDYDMVRSVLMPSLLTHNIIKLYYNERNEFNEIVACSNQ